MLVECIPPTFIIGIKVIAITIIPIPPNHWSIALHKSIDLGAPSKLEIIVDPVVVIPDILSKKESVIDSSRVEKIKGKEPNIAIFGSLPFIFSTLELSITDSFFESMSGITTTGSTIISNLEGAPRSILLWRAMLQWLGGIGIIVMAITLMPIMNVGGMHSTNIHYWH